MLNKQGGSRTIDINIKIGAQAGQGLQTMGLLLSKAFVRSGMYVFSGQYYLSRVRGGHNTYEIRISDRPVQAMRDHVDILIALDRESITEHTSEMTDDGIIIADREKLELPYTIDNNTMINIPLSDLAEKASGNNIYSNTIAMGSLYGLLGLSPKPLEELITGAFEKKGEKIVQENIHALRAGQRCIHEDHPEAINYLHNVIPHSEKKMLINGNDSVGLGALAAGLKFLAAYPMTPSTGVMNYVSSNAAAFNVVVEQAEDEIAALNMVIGASFAGARAMTTTSGGGFCLMAEALGLAGMTETPCVIFLSQRPGPATGLPTMTEQADLQFAINAAHGEFPRCILAPKDPTEAFSLTVRAFNLADKYQIPVIVMSDQYLADCLFTCERFDSFTTSIERHLLEDPGKNKTDYPQGYKRYLITESGISPRTIPGHIGALVVADSDEHNEYGHIAQTAENRILMHEKRLNKFKQLKQDVEGPAIYGNPDSDIALIGWGSTYGPLAEAVDRLRDQGKDITLVHFSQVYPLATKHILNSLNDRKVTVCAENNATGQFAKLIRSETGIKVSNMILRYDGRPFTPDYIIKKLQDLEVI